jgi:hypothetical protein
VVKIIQIFVYLLLLTAPVLAGWPDPRIVKMSDGGSGSFVAINGKVVILSCAHRTNTTAVTVGYQVRFECNDGTSGTATVSHVAPFDLDSETIQDCAIYTFPGTVGPAVIPLKLSQRPLQRGEKVWVCGFPAPRGDYSCRTTQVISDDGTLWLQGPATPGESGGPIINSDGDLVGTLTATTSDGTTMCCGRTVEAKFCQAVETDCCPGGNCQIVFQPPIRIQPAPRQVLPAPRPPQQSRIGDAPYLTPPTYSMLPAPPPLCTPPVAQVKPIPGPAGQQGQKGDKGDKGDAGPAYQPTEADIEAWAAMVEKRIKPQQPFYLRVNPTAPFKSVSPGQYVTLPLDRSQQK